MRASAQPAPSPISQQPQQPAAAQLPDRLGPGSSSSSSSSDSGTQSSGGNDVDQQPLPASAATHNSHPLLAVPATELTAEEAKFFGYLIPSSLSQPATEPAGTTVGNAGADEGGGSGNGGGHGSSASSSSSSSDSEDEDLNRCSEDEEGAGGDVEMI